MRIWAAEIEIDTLIAKRVIEDQFPLLSPARLELLGAGWDNTVFRLNRDFVFRFPRRQIAVDLLRTEVQCLPLLATRVPFPIPRPVHVGRPADEYPWPFAGYAFIPGSRAATGVEDLESRRRLAAALGEFLRALHGTAIHVFPAGALPPDTLDRLNCRTRRSATVERLAFLRRAGIVLDDRCILGLLDEAPEPPVSARITVTHGDLHVGQLLIEDSGRLTGVIDWGDMHCGDPAVDLAVVHQLLPPNLHDAFIAHYGAVDRTAWRLARARAAWHAVALLASAVDGGDVDLAAEARLAVHFITGGPAALNHDR